MRANEPSRLVRWLVIGPLALAGLAAVLFGAPALLLALGGNPLPEQLPSLDEAVDLFTRPDDGQLLLWALSVVGWVAWATVAGSLLLELGAQLTGRRTPHVPGLAGPQRFASLMVAGVLAALTTPGISHAQAAYVHAAAAEAPAAPQPPAAPPAVGAQIGEIPPPSGWIEPMEVRHTAEPDEPLVHEVAEGDWMWHIAGRYLGDEQRYPEIAVLNPEYDQRYDDYPDHIQPGDELVLPDDARDRGERRHATGELIDDDAPAEQPDDGPPPGEGEPPDPEDTEPEPEDTAEPADPPATTAPEPAPPEPTAPEPTAPEPTAPEPTAPEATVPETAAPETSAPAPTVPPESSAPEPSAPPEAMPGAPTTGSPAAGTDQQEAPPAPPGSQGDGGDPDGSDQDETSVVAWPLLTAGVLASLLVSALVLYRRRKQSRRRHRRAVTTTADASAETSLRAAASADVVRLDQALRFLSASLAGTGSARLPDIGAVWIGDGEIHLILATPTDQRPPSPFHAAAGSWFLPADATLPEVAGAAAPLPGLVTIGSQPGQHLLVDLERMGVLTITGQLDRGSDLLRYLAAELAHNPWSDQVTVILAGFPPEVAQALAGLNPDRIAVADSLPDAAYDLEQRLSHNGAALTSHGLADAVHGRVSDTVADTWTPHLLLVNRPRPEHDALLARLEEALAQAGRRCAVAVAAATSSATSYGRRSITITDDGLLKAGFLHESHELPAVALPEHLLGPLADLMRSAADDQDYRIPPATEAWAGETDATGALHEPPEQSAPQPAGTAVTGQEAQPYASATDPAELDPGLDKAVAQWWREADQPGEGGEPVGAAPRITLLGPVGLVAAGPPPTQRPRVCQELVVYLAACGDRGADAVELSRQLWPQEQISPTVRIAVIMSVRRWLGNAPDGEPWLSEATTDGRYRLREGPLIDWHLFRRLRARGERRGPAGAADLGAALQLVQGPPLHEADQFSNASSRLPYSWLPGSSFEPSLLLAGIVDTAHQLVELSLSTGDLNTARWAVGQAWLADPQRLDDHPWRDLLRIIHMQGDHDQLRDVVAELLRWREAEHPDELAPATAALIRSLLTVQPVRG